MEGGGEGRRGRDVGGRMGGKEGGAYVPALPYVPKPRLGHDTHPRQPYCRQVYTVPPTRLLELGQALFLPPFLPPPTEISMDPHDAPRPVHHHLPSFPPSLSPSIFFQGRGEWLRGGRDSVGREGGGGGGQGCARVSPPHTSLLSFSSTSREGGRG